MVPVFIFAVSRRITWQPSGVPTAKNTSRTLSIVARAVLGAPGSSAVLDRDFGEGGKLTSRRQRGSPDDDDDDPVLAEIWL